MCRVSDPHTSVSMSSLSVRYVRLWYIASGSAGHLRAITATMCAIVLLHSVSFIEQVCPTVRPNLSDTNRGRGEEWPLRLRTKELPHCTAPPTHYYLVHAHLAMFRIHLVRTPTSSTHAVGVVWCAQELRHTARRCKNSTKLISSVVSMAILLFTENW